MGPGRADLRSLVISQGDPRGVGPELLLAAAAEGRLREGDLVVAAREALEAVAPALKARGEAGLRAIEPMLVPVERWRDRPGAPAGQVAALETAVDRVLAAPGRALVTAPIDKAACRAEGFEYPGHTEYLAARAGTDRFAMLLAGPRLRVALVTIHVPLREVPGRVTEARIVEVGQLLAAGLRELFGIVRPRIGVLGLNPHAGEKGMLGDEEQRVVEPAVGRLRTLEPGAEIRGPLPADTAFHWHAEGQLDGVVAMYHDQGLGPFKLLHFHDGVNVTLGLPFVRTSPDHGTAPDIAGKGIANPSSFFSALALARGGGK